MITPPVLVRQTLDGRRVEVIGAQIFLDGRLEADTLVPIEEHPNRVAIQRAVPDAAYVAGRPGGHAQGARRL
jgi:hypothetical protein